MSRPHVELINESEVQASALLATGWPAGAQMQVLSSDPDSGAVTGILRLAAGYRRPPGALAADTELLVLSGAVRIGGMLRGIGYYEYDPAGAAQDSWIVAESCEMLFLARRGRPDFDADPGGVADDGARVQLETEAMPWEATPIPGPPSGLMLKPLRADPATGEMSALWSHPSRFPADGQYPGLEFHECVEESYCLGGDMWIGTSGTMVAGSYFWRPPFVSHGPFYSRNGSLTFVYFDGPLVNHLMDAPGRTPEQNRRWLEGQRESGSV